MAGAVFPRAVSLAAWFAVGPGLWAQKGTAPALDEMLRRLDANLSYYDTHVPSLFCDEHVVSQVTPGPRNQDTVTDSVFRLKRVANADKTTSLEEEREVREVDGRAARSQDLDGPSLLSGVFEGGLAVVSGKEAACMSYTVLPVKKHRLGEPYVVRFSTAFTPENSAGCLLEEPSTGRALIDPLTMQIKRLELRTPRHLIPAVNAYGRRDLVVEYAPVVLGEEAFWMPSAIAMHVVSGEGTFRAIRWSFQATYRNYHKLQVTSHLVPVER